MRPRKEKDIEIVREEGSEDRDYPANGTGKSGSFAESTQIYTCILQFELKVTLTLIHREEFGLQPNSALGSD